MKKVIAIVLLVFTMNTANAQEQIKQETKYYAFQVNYWMNLHHFLWLESFMGVHTEESLIDKELPTKEKKKLENALDYYRAHLVDKDLRMHDYMSDFKAWVSTEEIGLASIPNQFKDHVEVLKAVSTVYQEYFWKEHREACIRVLQNNLEMIKATEEAFVQEITKLTRQFWQDEKLLVDITYVAKASKRNLRNRPYTTLFPTHVVMNVNTSDDVPGNWIELLFHESAHHLILSTNYFIGGTINDTAEVMNTRPPRQLGHAYLFYLTGQLTKTLLEQEGMDYPEIYMQRNGVFSRLFPLLKKHLDPYMNRKLTLEGVTRNIMLDLKK